VGGASRVPGYGRYVIAPQPKAIKLQPIPEPIPLPIPMPHPNEPPTAKPLPPIPLPSRSNRMDSTPRHARLFDAVTTSVDRFMARKTPGRNALVILALADDADSTASLDDALRTLKKNRVTAFVIAVEDERPPLSGIVSGLLKRVDAIRRDDRDMAHIYTDARETRIARLAEETGGRVVKIKGFEKLREAFAGIADDLRQQQIVTYAAPKSEGASYPLKLDIRTSRKDATISAPDTRYTPQ
jgi:hypothetical protein